MGNGASKPEPQGPGIQTTRVVQPPQPNRTTYTQPVPASAPKPTSSSGTKPPLNNNQMLDAINEHSGGINCMALSEDASILVTGSEDKSLRLWTTKTKRCDCIGVLVGHTGYVSCVLIEEQYVVSASSDCTVRKWDMGTCECVIIFKGHTGRVNRVITTGDFIFTSSTDKTVRCWDFDRGTCIREFVGHQNGVFPLVFVPADDDDYDLYLAMKESEVDGRATALQQVNDIVISGSTDNTAKAWSFETGRCIRTFKGHSGAVTCVATDPDGDTLFTASTDFTLRSWTVNTGECLMVFNGHQATILCLTVVDKIVYSGSADMTARAWHPDQREAIAVFKGQDDTIMCIKHYDGNILTGSGDGRVMCYNNKSAELRQSFQGDSRFIINCMQVVDGRLFTGAADGILRLWAMSDYNQFNAQDIAQNVNNLTNQASSMAANAGQSAQRMANSLQPNNLPYNSSYNRSMPTTNIPQSYGVSQPQMQGAASPQRAPYYPSTAQPYGSYLTPVTNPYTSQRPAATNNRPTRGVIASS